MDQIHLINEHIAAVKQSLIVDCCGYSSNEFEITESTSHGKYGLARFRGKVQEADGVNKNKRSYPRSVLEANLERLMESLEERRLVGELDHPDNSIVHFNNVSHVMTKLWWEGNNLMGEGEILNTPSGLILKALHDAGIRWGISSRGIGSGSVNENGILVIGESFKLITFDAVADPSTYEAFQERIVSKNESAIGKKINITSQQVETFIKSSNNSEKSCIDKNNKDILCAFLEGFVNTQANKLKSRL